MATKIYSENSWLTEKQVAKLIARSVSALQKDRFKNRGINFVKIGRSVRYAYADVEAFMDAHKIRFDAF